MTRVRDLEVKPSPIHVFLYENEAGNHINVNALFQQENKWYTIEVSLYLSSSKMYIHEYEIKNETSQQYYEGKENGWAKYAILSYLSEHSKYRLHFATQDIRII